MALQSLVERAFDSIVIIINSPENVKMQQITTPANPVDIFMLVWAIRKQGAPRDTTNAAMLTFQRS